ncbi:glycosyltransferase [Sedimenticola hydrogenitrophicus]|uniref:glycosyltransferase n=1 Tax=Sedimenticola hydrogenitrophicus TaxID=2967975 RepID=UPI0023B06C3D|nr:hypothetical protein [Sedimenticola hydrogenitrophicus]
MSVLQGSVRALVGKTESALIQGRVSLALRIIHDFVERIVTEPICAAQVFASHDLDQLCLHIGRQNLVNLGKLHEDPWSDSTIRPRVAYIVSSLQKSGGHSRLVQDFVRSQPEKNHLILSTEVGGPSDKNYLAKLFAEDGNIRFLCAPRGDLQSRLTWLQSLLHAVQPEHVHLFNHHQDSVAVAALIPELELKGSFHHHGDHHLCLGVHMNHLTHVDLHPMGYHYCRDKLGIDNRYLPLTFEDKQYIPLQTEFMRGGHLTTATAARSNKVEIPYYVSYLDTIPHVLKITGGRHIHIGRLTPWSLHRIYSQMRKQGVQKDRFVYIQWTPSVWQSLQEHKVDVYIASFPYGAGLTLIEAMGAGIPVIMHQHMFSRVLSGLELAYPEAFRWADPEDLLAHLTALEPERLEREKRLSRLRYETFHRPEILRDYLRDPDSMQLPVPPLTSEFRPRHDERAAWVELQISLTHIIYRKAYRIMRSIRSYCA